VEFPITHETAYQIFEYACHEGDKAMSNRLSAVRAEEKTESQQKQFCEKLPNQINLNTCRRLEQRLLLDLKFNLRSFVMSLDSRFSSHIKRRRRSS
jgi:hypothetical protein